MRFSPFLRAVQAYLARRRRSPRRRRQGLLRVERLDPRVTPDVSFGSPITIPYGLAGSVLGATGDLNGDGLIDLTLVNTNHTASVLLGNGDGTFRHGSTSPTGASPSHTALANLDNDGKLDLATSDAAGDSLSVLRGNGDGTFGPTTTLPAGDYAFGVTAGDFDGDTHIDLATSNYLGDSVSVFLNDGNGSFQAAAPYPAGDGASNVEAADLDDDGNLDLVTANSDANTVAVLFGDGTGAFPESLVLNAEAYTYDLVAADLDGDGDKDLAAVNYNAASLSVFLNQGGRVFATSPSVPIGSNPNAIRPGDFNNDGKIDLAVSCYGSGAVAVLEGNGNGTFAAPVFLPLAGVQGVAAADFDGNGTTDLAGVTTGPDLTVWLSQSTPANPHLGIAAPAGAPIGTPFTVTVTALDGSNNVLTSFTGTVHFRSSDRFADLPADYTFTGADAGVKALTVTSNTSGTQTVSATLVGSSGIVAGTAVDVTLPPLDFDTPVVSASEYNGLIDAYADMNGDGLTDLVMAFNNDDLAGVLLGNGDGTFQLPRTTPTGDHPTRSVVGDLNHDGFLDVVTSDTFSHSVSVLLSNGDGTLQSARTLPIGSGSPDGTAVGNFNGDIHPDIAVSLATDGQVGVFLGHGDGTFEPLARYDTAGITRDVHTADFNNDGKLDLVATAWYESAVSLMLGTGNDTDTFGAAQLIPTAFASYALTPGDFNRDGWMDLAVTTGPSHSVSILLNREGTLSLAAQLPVNHPTAISTADLNSDGLLDLAVGSDDNNSATVFLGNGDGSFTGVLTFPTAYGPWFMVAGDVDGNGTADLVTAGASGGTIATRLNQANPANPHLSLSAPASTPLDTPFTVTVTALDADNQVATGFTGTVHFRSSDRFAGLPADYTFTAADNGVHTFPVTLRTGGTQTVSAALVGSPGIVAGATVTVNVPAVSFGPPANTPVGSGPAGAASGDFNGDGILDMAVAEWYSGDVRVLRGNGDGTFLDTGVYATGYQTYAAVSADFDGDGFLDLAATNVSSNALSILMGNGSGTFNPAGSYTAGGQPYRLAVGDFNGDDKPDLVTSDYATSTVSVFLGNGTGTFQTAAPFAAGAGAVGVAVGDFNGDTIQDLATADYSGATMSVLLGKDDDDDGKGDGTFEAPVSYASGAYPQTLSIADFNADGKADIAVANYGSHTVTVFRGNGNGTFQGAVPYAVGAYPNSVRVADLNQDGKLDLVSADSGSNTVSVLLGNGNGTFQSAVSFATDGGPYVALPADWDGNGTLDLATPNFYANTVSILFNLASPADPHLAIAAPATVEAGMPFTVTVTALDDSEQVRTDFTGTVHFGSSDPLAGLPDDYTFTAADQGTRTFTVTLQTGGSQTVSAALVGAEGIVAGTAVDVTLVPIDFAPGNDFLVGYGAAAIAQGDFNGDGLIDLVTPHAGDGTLGVHLNNGDGTFQNNYSVSSIGGNPYFAAVGDLNEDGYLDIATVTYVGQSMAVIFGNGDGTFTDPDIYEGVGVGVFGDPRPHRPTGVAFGYFDDDTHLDIITVNYETLSGSVAVFLNDPQDLGNFGAPNYTLSGAGALGIAVADLDHDGELDVLTGDYRANTLSVLIGDGSGGFTTRFAYGSGSNPFLPVTADFDADGWLDVAVINTNEQGGGAPTVSVFRGLPGGAFDLRHVFPADVNPYGGAAGDLNEDGFTDLIVTGHSTGQLTVWLGNGNFTFQGPMYLPAQPYVYSTLVADLDGNGPIDVAATIASPSPQNIVSLLFNQAAPHDPHLLINVPALAEVGVSFTVTVTALDSDNNISTGFTGTVHFASSDRIAGLPPDYTFTAADASVKTFTVTLNTVGIRTVTAALVGSPGIIAGRPVTVSTRPTADPGGPYLVVVGGQLVLDGSGSSDPEQPADTLTYAWDLDGDGSFGETGAAALYGDEVGPYPAFAAPTAGDQTLTVALRVTDAAGLTDTATASLTVTAVNAGLTPQPRADNAWAGAQFPIHGSAWPPYPYGGVRHDVGADAAGNLVVVWDRYISGFVEEDIYGRLLYPNGSYRSGEFRINNAPSAGHQGSASVEVADAGHWIATWQSASDPDGSWGIRYQLFGADGAALTGEGQANAGWQYEQVGPGVAMNPATGEFVMIWGSNYGDGYPGYAVIARRFAADGTPLDEFLVSDPDPASQYYASVAMDRSGNFVVTWTAFGGDAGTDGSYLRVYRADGFVSPQIRIHGRTAGDQWAFEHSVAYLDDGRFVVSWGDSLLDGDGWGCYARIFDAYGNPLGGEFRVSTTTAGYQSLGTVVATHDGGFIILWGAGDDSAVTDVFGQRYAADGTALGTNFPVNTFTDGNQNTPRGVVAADGTLTVTWIGWTDEGGYSGVFGRQYTLPSEAPTNSPPDADAGGPYVLSEGADLTLDASGSSDPDDDTLSYTWDVNGDGVFDDATGVSPTLTWTQLNALGIDDGPATFGVRVRVDDGNGHVVTSDPVTLTVTNVAPTAGLTGPATGVRYQPRTFTLGAADPSPADQADDFTYDIDWDGDSTVDETVTGPDGRTASHAYTATGSYNVRLTATDKDGATSDPVNWIVTISVIEMQGSDLAVGGTSGDDTFLFYPGANTGEVVAVLNGTTLGTFTPTGAVRIFAGPGTDSVTVRGDGAANAFEVRPDEVRYNGLPFAGTDVESWTADGRFGNDTFTYYGGAATLLGGGGSDELIAANAGPNTWHITGSNSGDLNGILVFSSVSRLTGNSADDTFLFGPSGSVGGTINADGGSDTLDYSAVTVAVSVNLQSGGATRTGGIAGFEVLIGGSGTDTLTGNDVVHTWNLNGADAGDIDGAVTYRSFENIRGGRAADTFVVTAGDQVSGSINGSGGSDTLDYTGYGSPVTVNMQTRTATAVGSFASIMTILGSAASDTFMGTTGDRSWLLSGTDTGTLAGVTFQGFENLVGSTGNDTFRFAAAGGVTGTVSGGGGTDELDYSLWSAAVTVNLTTGTASAMGGVTGIRNIMGGSGADTLIGDAADNTFLGGGGDDLLLGAGGADNLEGNAGRDLIFGGSGADTLEGGVGDDVVLGALLAYLDETTGAVDFTALAAIRDEWTRTDLDYATRISNLSQGGGLNGSYVLNATTVLDDDAVDTLFGRGGLDWFLVSLDDLVEDLNASSETVTLI